MSYFDTYKSLLAVQGGTVAGLYKSTVSNLITSSFKDSPNYALLDIDGVNTDCRIVNTDKSDIKEILFPSGISKTIGSVVTIGSDKWIAIESVSNSVFSKIKIQKCNYNLKWQYNGQIYTYPCVITNKIGADGVDEQKYMTLPIGQMNVIIKNDSITREIKRDKRFLIDGEPWRVIFVDRVTIDGIIQLNITNNGEQLNLQTDRIDLGIADYIDTNYTLTILNGDTATIQEGSTLQLNVQVKQNETIISSPITYTSSDTNIATVDSNGFVTGVSAGNVTITATSNGVSDVIDITVEALPIADNYTFTITGATSIKQNSTQTYTAKLFNNGVEVAMQPTTWSISDSTLATIVSQTDSSCTIRALKSSGSVTLTIVLDSDIIVTKSMTIALTGLW